MQRYFILLIALLVLSATTVFASVPNSLNYQGRLTDNSGVAVADGQYLVRFNIYDAETGGLSLWDSGFRAVIITDGLFQYNLGDSTALPNSIFIGAQRWLGIQVGADPEISPRTELTSSAFSFKALNADSLGNMAAESYLHQGFDTLTSFLSLQTLDGGGYSFSNTKPSFGIGRSNFGGVSLSPDSNLGGYFILGQAGTTGGSLTTVQLWAGNGATKIGPGIQIGKSIVSGSGMTVTADSTGNPRIFIRASPNSSDSAQDANIFIGNSAVNSSEMFNEPGIAANSTPTNITWPLFPTISDILTVTITIPSNGYVVVEGTTILRFASSPVGRIAGQMQIDTLAGGSLESPHTSWAGLANIPSSPLYQSGVARRVYFYSKAGTHTFRLEASQTTGDVGSSIQSINSWLQATYYPTSYGSVTTLTESPGDNPTAKRVTILNEDGTTTTAYEVDLRHYELKALKARLDAEQAELQALKAEAELRQARMEQAEMDNR